MWSGKVHYLQYFTDQLAAFYFISVSGVSTNEDGDSMFKYILTVIEMSRNFVRLSIVKSILMVRVEEEHWRFFCFSLY